MKKFISLILAAGMIATSMATIAHADTTPVKMKAEVTKYVAEEGNKIYDFYDGYMGEQPEVPAGGALYLVEFKLADIKLGRINKTSSTDSNPRVKAFELYYKASDVENIESIIAYEDNETDATEDKIQFIPTVARLNGSNFEVKAADTSGKGLWPTSLVNVTDYTEAAPTVALCGALITVKDASKQVTFTEVKNTDASETLLQTYGFNGGTAAPADDGKYTAPTGTFAIETITLGEKASEPTAPVVTGVDAGEVVTDGVNGKVWNDVKIENATLGTNYRAKFTETVSGETSTHNFRNLGELGGTATFAVVLNTARDVANIVLEILYDAVQ